MKTIEQAAEEYAKSNWETRLSNHVTETDFKAGVEFVQRWIPVEEEIYPSHKQILVKTDNGSIYDVVYNSHDNKITAWWGSGHWEIYKDEIVSWRPIEQIKKTK